MHEPVFFFARIDPANAPGDAANNFARTIRCAFPALEQVWSDGEVRMIAPPQSVKIIEGRSSAYIVGDIYPSDAHHRLRALNPAKNSSPMELARALISTCWGSYVALIVEGTNALVLRGPSGALPLYTMKAPGLTIAATEFTPRLARAAGARVMPDLHNLAHVLAYPPAAVHLSLVQGISVIAPGEACLLTDAKRAAAPERVHALWSPAAIAAQRRELEPNEIREELDAIVCALASGKRVGVELSGGFDSSSVLASLLATNQSAHPFNVATSAGGGDERSFARSMSGRWHLPLAEFKAGSVVPDYRALLNRPQQLMPVLTGLDSVFASARDHFVKEASLDLVMTGQGGDALFFQLPTRLVAADRLRTIGARAFALDTLKNDAVRCRCSIWSVAATALGFRASADREQLPGLTPHLLGDCARHALRTPAPAHPWIAQAGRLPPAKRRHLMLLVHSQLVHGPRLFAPQVPLHHPLLAQPLVERFLACPIHLLAQGTLDRGLARRAMQDRLPADILHRRTKGEATDHYARAVLHNRHWLADMLLDGALAGAGLLDTRLVARALDPQAIALGTDYRAFPLYASLESWLRYWINA